MEGFPYYRVRLDDAVAQCELEELLALADEGLIHSDTLIIPPFSSAWQAASTLIELSSHLAHHTPNEDPWDAWESMDEGASEDSSDAWTDGSADAPPMSSMKPPKAPPTEPPLLTDESIRPLDPDRQSQKPGPSRSRPRRFNSTPTGRGQVIAFPQDRSRHSTDGAYALAADAFPTLTPPKPRPAQSSALEMLSYTVRWQRLIPMVGVGLMGIAVAWFWFLEQASASFPPHPDALYTDGQVVSPPGDADPVVDPQQVQDQYEQLEQRIRQRMSMEVALIRTPGTFEDIMYVELQQSGLDLVGVNANVTGWGGQQQDVPEKVDFRIRVRSREGQLDQELGTIALIVGKYIARYDLTVQRLEVVLESPGQAPVRWLLDPEVTRYLFNQRISLLEFLNSLR